MKSALLLGCILVSLALFGAAYYKGFDPVSDLFITKKSSKTTSSSSSSLEDLHAKTKSPSSTTTDTQKYTSKSVVSRPPSIVIDSSSSKSKKKDAAADDDNDNNNNDEEKGVENNKKDGKSSGGVDLSTKFLLSRRYNQAPADYEANEKKKLKKALSKLAKVDLVKEINGIPIEPIDTMIGLGGKRLKRIKLLGRELASRMKKSGTVPFFPDDDKSRRLVWFDLGARVWPKGSTQWFSRHYPNSTSYEAELYDVLDLVHSYPKEGQRPFKNFNFYAKAAWIKNGEVEIGGKKMASVAEEGKKLDPKKITVWKTEAVDFGKLLLENYKEDKGFERNSDSNNKDITMYVSEKKKNFIVVKMDVEGGEWPLVKHLEQTGALARIDEMMLECHPPAVDSEYSTSDKPWKAKRHGEMPTDCIRLINRMRLSGVYCHGWF